MTSRFILNKFDLDLSSSGLLVGFGLLLVLVLVARTVDSVLVVDERVVAYWGRLLGLVRMRICGGSSVAGMHIQGARTLAHGGRRGRLGSWGSLILSGLGLVVLNGIICNLI